MKIEHWVQGELAHMPVGEQGVGVSFKSAGLSTLEAWVQFPGPARKKKKKAS